MPVPADVTAVVVANGVMRDHAGVRALLAPPIKVYAADGGANWLDERGLRPDVLVGDMDSVRPELLERLEREGRRIVRHPTDKDETDTELALRVAAEDGHAALALLGAMGDRLDHSLANVAVLAAPFLEEATVCLYDGVARAWHVRRRQVVDGAPGDVVSLLPLGERAEGIRTEGLAYALDGGILEPASPRGVSNVMTAERAIVTLERGRVYVFHVPASHLR
jgi:thiamine pyrophosphokinase